MDGQTQQWLISKLGTKADLVDLDTRLLRLGRARAVALEVLNERKAEALRHYGQPAPRREPAKAAVPVPP